MSPLHLECTTALLSVDVVYRFMEVQTTEVTLHSSEIRRSSRAAEVTPLNYAVIHLIIIIININISYI